MKTALKILPMLMSFAVLAGCGSPPKQHVFINSRSYDRTFDEVWNHLLQYFTEHAFNVVQKSRDGSLARITARKGIITHDIIADCGNFDIWIPSISKYSYPDAVFASLTVIVAKEEDKANVKIEADLSVSKFVRAIDGPFKEHLSFQDIHCASTGVLEQQILNSL